MKKFLFIAYAVFFIGLFFKLFHLLGANMLFLLGTLLLLIQSMVYLIKNAKKNLPSVFLNLTFSFWSIYLFFKFQYLPFSIIIFGVSFLISLTYLVLCIVYKSKFKIPQILVIVYFVFSLFIGFTQAHKIYFVFNYSILSDPSSPNLHYEQWDKYSWFLYNANKQEEALDANLNAQKSIINAKNTIWKEEQEYFSKRIQRHRALIIEKNWVDYP